MKNLEDYTEEELLAAIEAKKVVKSAIPDTILEPYWGRVIELAVERRDKIATEARPPKDSVHYIFEEVMKAVFGYDYFKWENKHNKGE